MSSEDIYTISRQDRQFFIAVLLFILLLSSLPYVYAALKTHPGFVFGGFLLNPIDGNSYLAKMYQGWQGYWKFRLPYTSKAEAGTYFFLFYLFLGHLARLLGLSLIWMFHISRIISASVMFFCLFRFYHSVLLKPAYYRYAFLLGAIGSGLGWLGSQFGVFSSDLWVAEAYPFLSTYANPHFPLGLAILLQLVPPNTPLTNTIQWKEKIYLLLSNTLLAVLLSLIMPFASLLALTLNGIILLYFLLVAKIRLGQLLHQRNALRFVGIILGSLPILFYYLSTIKKDPWLAGWNAQNITPAPTLLDLFISLSPATFMAIFAIKRPSSQLGDNRWFLFSWLLVGLILVYLPIGLQRRFMVGIYIPFAGLAGITIGNMLEKGRQYVRLAVFSLLILSSLTNLLVLASAWYGVYHHSPLLYLRESEYTALKWIEENTPEEAVIASSPEIGLFIPAYTGRRVIYGHPFETVKAEEAENKILHFFDQQSDPLDMEITNSVDYVFVGPREGVLGGLPSGFKFTLVYQNSEVKVFRVH
ncbi:MAG: hypothetical protein QW279_10075 [Candidatus Jordarchaeaceae archaeon]